METSTSASSSNTSASRDTDDSVVVMLVAMITDMVFMPEYKDSTTVEYQTMLHNMTEMVSIDFHVI